ncbi:ClpP/crotonase-like domain-containing protein [Suillus subalutaceus]|uniref:ClpP/crotonase-like domain-containing protein n=1 Tax=Suillus subalutaceus TaxID=48586 RepID=UPI001B87C983|nr:ClpP/crotonase-like domain-containing protein [Suillus subalutaceus]KAG1846798.1 ClpP/crotonase-like domain-containing protein [Suillus subalutaceus]
MLYAGRVMTIRLSRRLFSTQVPEAFLEPLQSHLGITCLSFNRPQAKNAISMKLLHVKRHPTPIPIRALIIRSTTMGSFCAGADLAERRTMSQIQITKFLSDLRTALGQLETLPMPTIAAIDGPALGGGLELSFACDLRVAGHGVTKIGLPETRLGIIPGAGGTQRAVRLLGVSKAKALIFTAKMLTAQEALEWGVVDYVSSPSTSAFERAVELAQEITKSGMHPHFPRATSFSTAISRAADLSLESGLDLERASYEVLLPTKDRLEALEAFKEKRQPVFKGE